MQFVWEYLNENRPARINHCFCHGDFHYANILWKDKKMSAILDFELAGQGNQEFDIAWTIIRRPGQRFMKTPEEEARFMDGYLSLTLANVEWVRYYMVLIYSYFYEAGKDDPEYQEFVRCFLHESCR